MEEGNIDRDRIVDEHLVCDEYFCPICQCLLWKPCACSKCQHFFCQKCLHTWLENPISAKRCPFRCESFEERRCPPSIHSGLDRLNIYCRNSEFGCTQILSYNSLEQHENVECEYLSQQCSECGQLVLISKMDEHREMLGLCVPHPIKCTVCQIYFEKPFFKDHFHECFQNRIAALVEENFLANNVQTTTNGEQVASPIWQRLILFGLYMINLIEQQRQFSPIPTNLIGINAVRQARERGCGFFYHIFMMLTFIFTNGFKAPFLILAFSAMGFIQCTGIVFILYSLFLVRTGARIYQGCCFIMLFTYILTYGILLLFRYVSDPLIIYLFGLFIFLCGSSDRIIPLELLEMNSMIHMTKTNIALCCAALVIMKILLLLCRLYYWCIPAYLTAGSAACINFGIAIHRKRASQTTTPSPVVQTTTTT